MLPALIQRYDKKNHCTFDQDQNERISEILQAIKCHIFYRINTIYQFINNFLDIKCVFLRDMEPLTNVLNAETLW